jgi:hypothetical protein
MKVRPLGCLSIDKKHGSKGKYKLGACVFHKVLGANALMCSPILLRWWSLANRLQITNWPQEG